MASTFNTMLDALSRAQQEVQESEVLYRSLVDYSPDMITVHSREGRTLFINPAGVKLMGAQNAEELVGQPVMDIVPLEIRDEAQRGMEDIIATGKPTPLLQQKMHRMDGTSFEAEFRAIPISYAGQPAIQFVMRDITERRKSRGTDPAIAGRDRRSEGTIGKPSRSPYRGVEPLNLRLQDELTERQRLVQSLQESEQRFRLVFDTSPDAIFLIDPHDPDGDMEDR